MPYDGFVQLYASCDSDEIQIFHRIKINGIVLDEGYTEKRNYNYYASQLLPVRKGDHVEIVGETPNAIYSTYFYRKL